MGCCVSAMGEQFFFNDCYWEQPLMVMKNAYIPDSCNLSLRCRIQSVKHDRFLKNHVLSRAFKPL